LCTSVGSNDEEWAKSVRIPTFVHQVHDNIPVAEKKLQWIGGTKSRWDGYLEFQRRLDDRLGWY